MKALWLSLTLLCAGRLMATNALQLGFMEGNAGTEIEIPIFHTGDAPVAGANVDFHFDPAKMEFLEILPGSSTTVWALDAEQVVADEVRLLLTHPSTTPLPAGEIARVKVRLLETFTHSETTGAALVRRDTPTPTATLTDCHWIPLLEITTPNTGSKLANSAPNPVQFRLSPGERPLSSLSLLLEDSSVLTAPSVADRTFSWQPNLTAGGLLNLSVQAIDDLSLTSTSAPVEVLINTPPVLASIPAKSINELTALTFTASATDSDLPANTLTYSLISPPTGAAINATTGAFTWTPTEAQGPGNFNITVRVSDGTATADRVVAVTVNEVNIAPVLATIAAKSVNELAQLTFTAAATDADLPANTLTYSLVTPPTGAAINPTTGVFTWTPTESQGPGNFNITVRVSDGTATADRVVAVTVNEVNIAPVLAAIAAKSVNELAQLTFTAAATDADLPANTLTYSLIGAPTGAGIVAGTGVFTWTPTEAQGPGTFNFTVRVSDGTATTDQTVAVTVNEVNIAPVLAAIAAKSVNELAQLTFTAAATDADLPANTLTYSLIGAPTGAGIVAGTGVFTWTPTEAQGPGTFNFTVRVSDGTTTTDQPVKVTVSEVNIAPVLAAIPAKLVNELTALTFNVSATDADLPANTLTYSLVSPPTGASINPTTGIFTWTPSESQGPETFNITVRVSDGTATADQIVEVTVKEVNIAPVLADIPAKSVNELSELTFTASATDADLPANTLTYSLISPPTGAVINATTGAFTWTPTESQGPETFNITVRVSDGTATADRVVAVTVNEVNIAPVLATIAAKSVNELAQLTFTAAATDADLPANTLTYSLVTPPTGAAINPTTGVFTWTPTESQGPGNFNITVRVSDGTATADRVVAVTVNEVNIAPVLAAIPAKLVNELTQLTFTAAATDADLPANILTYSLVSPPTGAAIAPTTGVFTWTPTESQGPGTFNITVRVSDGTATAEQTVAVTVNEVNIAPVLAAITVKTVNELAPLTFTAAATDADLPANTLTYSLIGAPIGAGIVAGTGVFTWTPSESQGPRTFNITVRVSDGTATADQIVEIAVNEVNTAPVLASIPAKSVNELSELTFTASATDADLPANALTYSLVTSPSGASINPSTGVFSWTPNAFQPPGSYSIILQVSDGSLSNQKSVAVQILDVTPPVLTLPNSIIVTSDSPQGAIVRFFPTALDAYSGTVAVTTTPASGSQFPLGTTLVSASATDAAGNRTTGSFKVSVVNPRTLLGSPVITPAAPGRAASIIGNIRNGPSDGRVILQASPNLADTQAWINLSEVVLDASGNADFGPVAVPGSDGWIKCFFRIQMEVTPAGIEP